MAEKEGTCKNKSTINSRLPTKSKRIGRQSGAYSWSRMRHGWEFS
jgi:hypothetical protein